MAIYKKANTIGLASATSANGTARNGASLSLELCDVGTLSCQCSVTIVTGSVVCTWKPQVSWDGTNWFDIKTINNAAAVTSTADATLNLAIPQECVAGWNFFRMVATLSGAATAAGDLTAVTYRYVQPGGLQY